MVVKLLMMPTAYFHSSIKNENRTHTNVKQMQQNMLVVLYFQFSVLTENFPN